MTRLKKPVLNFSNLHSISKTFVSVHLTKPPTFFSLLATVLAIRELTHKAEEYDENFVIVLSDANFDRYGISPTNFGKILRNDQVCAYAIFIGSLGDQADRLTQRMPAGKAFVCLDTKRIPEVLKTIFTSTMLK